MANHKMDRLNRIPVLTRMMTLQVSSHVRKSPNQISRFSRVAKSNTPPGHSRPSGADRGSGSPPAEVDQWCAIHGDTMVIHGD